MRNNLFLDPGSSMGARLTNYGLNFPRKTVIGVIMIIALFAFEIFNFDTTQYALQNLLGDVRFIGLQWASILAIAFCSIDFAGLVRLFTPERGQDEPKEVWYLMGAWLLGATMNAIMTWWAVSLTLLNHQFGNEVMSREQLLEVVPIFVAVLVWLTRILFIGAFTITGEHIFDMSRAGVGQARPSARPAQAMPMRAVPQRSQPMRAVPAPQARPPMREEEVEDIHDYPAPLSYQRTEEPPARTVPPKPQRQPTNSRIRQRPPMPNGARRMPLNGGVQASSRDQN
jgi:hypothetical protein